MSLLSMLNPGLPFPDNEGVFELTKKCPLCKGLKWKVRPNVRKKIEGVVCTRCAGTGRQHEPGGQHSTRAKKVATLSAQDVIGYAQGTPDREWKALLWKYHQDTSALRDVQAQLMEYTQRLAVKQSWTYVESSRAPRIERLCLLACFEMEDSKKYDNMRKRANVMEIDGRAFERSWWEHYVEVRGEVKWWSNKAEHTIYRRHREGFSE